MVRRAVVLVLAALVAMLAACGGSDGTDQVSVEGQPYVDALAGNLRDHGAGDVQLTASEAACVAPKWVNVLQPERLDQAGIEPADLEPDDGLDEKAGKVALRDAEIGELVDALGQCDLDLQTAFIATLTEGARLSLEDQDCLDDAISDDLARKVVGLQVTEGTEATDGDAALQAEVFQALSACPGAIDLGS